MNRTLKLMMILMLGCGLTGAQGAIAQQTPPGVTVQVVVLCADAAVRQSLQAALQHDLNTDGYGRGKPWPMLRIFVDAIQDVNSPKNPHGWTFAVAHAFFQPLLAAAAHLVKAKHPPAPNGPIGHLVSLLLESQGTLTYINVIEIDHLDQRKITLLAGNIINSFSKRWPPHGSLGPKPKPLPQLAGGRPDVMKASPRNSGATQP